MQLTHVTVFMQTVPSLSWCEKDIQSGDHLKRDVISNYSIQILMVSIHMHMMVSVHVHTMVSVHVHTMVSVHVHTMVSVHRASAHCTGQGSLPWGMSKLETSLWRGTIVN